jgi:hypothetical protein
MLGGVSALLVVACGGGPAGGGEPISSSSEALSTPSPACLGDLLALTTVTLNSAAEPTFVGVAQSACTGNNPQALWQCEFASMVFGGAAASIIGAGGSPPSLGGDGGMGMGMEAPAVVLYDPQNWNSSSVLGTGACAGVFPQNTLFVLASVTTSSAAACDQWVSGSGGFLANYGPPAVTNAEAWCYENPATGIATGIVALDPPPM